MGVDKHVSVRGGSTFNHNRQSHHKLWDTYLLLITIYTQKFTLYKSDFITYSQAFQVFFYDYT